MLSNEKQQQVLSRISEIEKYVTKHDDKEIAIGVLCSNKTASALVCCR